MLKCLKSFPIHVIGVLLSYHCFSIFCGMERAFSIEISTIGNPNSKTQVIYLHGADTYFPSANERHIRTRLTQIADELDLFIVLPRSNIPCPKHVDKYFNGATSYCWEANGNEADLIQQVKESVLPHFKNNDRSYGLIGFSSGARLANIWMLTQSLEGQNPPLWSVSVACADAYPLDLNSRNTFNVHPQKMAFVLGDREFGPQVSFLDWLYSFGSSPFAFFFHGGHQFSGSLTRNAILWLQKYQQEVAASTKVTARDEVKTGHQSYSF